MLYKPLCVVTQRRRRRYLSWLEFCLWRLAAEEMSFISVSLLLFVLFAVCFCGQLSVIINIIAVALVFHCLQCLPKTFSCLPSIFVWICTAWTVLIAVTWHLVSFGFIFSFTIANSCKFLLLIWSYIFPIVFVAFTFEQILFNKTLAD